MGYKLLHINCYIMCHFKFLTMINAIVGVGAVGAASRYGSGSNQMMRLRLRNTDLNKCLDPIKFGRAKYKTPNIHFVKRRNRFNKMYFDCKCFWKRKKIKKLGC
jgi:hypothetical protein